jgi:hypothetical protein
MIDGLLDAGAGASRGVRRWCQMTVGLILKSQERTNGVRRKDKQRAHGSRADCLFVNFDVLRASNRSQSKTTMRIKDAVSGSASASSTACGPVAASRRV